MEKLTLGLSTTVTGMLVVFVGLLILIGCIYVMTLFTARPKKEAPHPVESAPIVPVKEMVIDQTDEESDMQVIAAITAAVAMILGQEGKPDSGFIVRRVRRAPAAGGRARAAREEQIFSRL